MRRNNCQNQSEGVDFEAAGTEQIVVVGDMHKLWNEDINSTLKTITKNDNFTKELEFPGQAMVCNVEFMFFSVVYAYPQRRQSILYQQPQSHPL